MIYLGIDVAKNSHVAAAMSSEGEVLLMPFPFANSADGFSLLREKLKGAVFADPKYSTDNAMGVAILTWRSMQRKGG